jgi:hypothetical protein
MARLVDPERNDLTNGSRKKVDPLSPANWFKSRKYWVNNNKFRVNTGRKDSYPRSWFGSGTGRPGSIIILLNEVSKPVYVIDTGRVCALAAGRPDPDEIRSRYTNERGGG